MNKVKRSDLKNILEYEMVRDSFRSDIIELKKLRRVPLGPSITLLFENRETVIFQIQEMMRVERIVLEDRIEEEIQVYNALIPEKGRLSATMFIEIPDQALIQPNLDSLMGIDQGQKLWIQFGDERVYAKFEVGHSNEVKISAVHFLQFSFSNQQQSLIKTIADFEFHLGVEHKGYQHRTRISAVLVGMLIPELEL
jgi:hypothetical protein